MTTIHKDHYFTHREHSPVGNCPDHRTNVQMSTKLQVHMTSPEFHVDHMWYSHGTSPTIFHTSVPKCRSRKLLCPQSFMHYLLYCLSHDAGFKGTFRVGPMWGRKWINVQYPWWDIGYWTTKEEEKNPVVFECRNNKTTLGIYLIPLSQIFRPIYLKESNVLWNWFDNLYYNL